MTFANPDFQALFDFLLGTAKKLLEKQNGFLPCAAFLPPEGKKVAVVSIMPPEEQPGAQRVLQLLEPALRKMVDKGMCRAIGMAIDTRLKAAPRKEAMGKDAIWITLEHKDGSAIQAATPYCKNWLGALVYQDTFTGSAKPQFFRAPRH